jgi:hypothetical protein
VLRVPKLAYLLFRNPDLTCDEFVRHYGEVHSPLSVEAMPLQTFYVANLADESDALRANAVGSMPVRSPVDAIAFLRFDDLGVLSDPARLYATRELEERLTADGAYLFSRMHGYVVDEIVQWDTERTWPLGQPSPGVKEISLVRKALDADRDEFRRHLEDAGGPHAPGRHPGVRRSVQNFVVDAVTADAAPLDALIELQFRTEEDFRDGHRVDGESTSASADDAARFVDHSATVSIVSRETVWIA